MITRRDFIKGMGALALLPVIMLSITNSIYNASTPQCVQMMCPWDGLTLDPAPPDWSKCKLEVIPCKWEVKTDNTGTITIPHVEDGERTDYKVRYTVTEDGTEAEIVGEE